jgi:N-acetylglucosamine-6-phosphate deacetylase
MYIDLQVNGYHGVDLNGEPLEADQLQTLCERLRADRVAQFLPTLITDSIPTLCARAERIATLREELPLAREMIAGIHFEGPFLNPQPGYIGAHPQEWAITAAIEPMRRLLDAAHGMTRLVTLAPECDPGCKLTEWLSAQGIFVAAGHTDASLEQLQDSLKSGLKMFTHLGNGCPSQLPRHDNIIQRVLSLADRLWISFIADGHHVPAFALRNYLKITGFQRAIVVTDAIAAAGLGPGFHQLGRNRVEVTSDGACWGPGRAHFAGSATTMPQSESFLGRVIDLEESAVKNLLYNNPLQIVRSSDVGNLP